MRIERDERIFLLRFDPGEELVSGLEKFAGQSAIESAEVRAIGALTDIELGYYVIAEKKYARKKVNAFVELISCLGNLSIREGKNFAHLHVSLGLQDYFVLGGHLFSATVSATVEAFVFPFSKQVQRRYDERTGLFLLDLPGETF